MSKNELKFRCRYFWTGLKMWVHEVLTYKPPAGTALAKRKILYGLTVDGVWVEIHEGTFWEFVKWIVTHERIGIV